MNIYTRVYEKCICNMSVRERENHEIPECLSYLHTDRHNSLFYLFVCTRAICICANKNYQPFLFFAQPMHSVWSKQKQNPKNKKQKQRKMGRKNPFLKFDCTMIFLLAFISSVFICFCCRCSYIGLYEIKHTRFTIMESHVAEY